METLFSWDTGRIIDDQTAYLLHESERLGDLIEEQCSAGLKRLWRRCTIKGYDRERFLELADQARAMDELEATCRHDAASDSDLFDSLWANEIENLQQALFAEGDGRFMVMGPRGCRVEEFPTAKAMVDWLVDRLSEFSLRIERAPSGEASVRISHHDSPTGTGHVLEPLETHISRRIAALDARRVFELLVVDRRLSFPEIHHGRMVGEARDKHLRGALYQVVLEEARETGEVQLTP